MGMSIEEAIRRIDEHNYIHQRKEPRAVYITEALDVAIDTMRKYQKIKEIVAKWEEEVRSGISCSFDKMEDIKEVVKDGKDNNANE